MILILGIGNSLRRDDGFGPAVVERLRPMYQHRPEIKLRSVHQLLPEMALDISVADRVILIDAAVSESSEMTPGALRVQPVVLDGQPHTQFAPPLSHHFTPEMLLQLTYTIYGKAGEMQTVTAVGADFEVGETLSPQVEVAVNQATDLIRERLTGSKLKSGKEMTETL